MEKLIIENHTDLKMNEALRYAKMVIEQGRISENHKGNQYCFATLFKKKELDKNGVVVYADKNKKSDRLIICPDRSKPMK
jgi:hypothetical protein